MTATATAPARTPIRERRCTELTDAQLAAIDSEMFWLVEVDRRRKALEDAEASLRRATARVEAVEGDEPPETLDLAALRAENERLTAELERHKAYLRLVDTWPLSALAVAMEVLEAPQVYAGLWQSQRHHVDRIRSEWNDLTKRAMPVRTAGH